MDIQSEKLHLIEELARTEYSDIVEQVKQLLKQKDNPVVGFEIGGLPITRKQLVQRIEEAESRMDNNDFVSQQYLEKESESW